jgi:5'-nucleotidase
MRTPTFLLLLLTTAASCSTAGTSGARSPDRRPLILLTNDDGIDAPGLRAALEILEGLGDVLVAAPARNSSGVSQSIEINQTVRVIPIARESPKDPLYAVEGPPATCVLLAVEHLAKGRKIDLVVSGINTGENVGLDIACSGTVGAARIAADLGIPAIALSLAYGSKEFRSAAEASARLIREALDRGREGTAPGTVINVNFPRHPPSEWKRWVLAAPGGRGFALRYELHPPAGADPAPDVLFEPKLALAKGPFPEGSDAARLAEGHVTVTVLGAIAADSDLAERLQDWSCFR